jgi:hypothetical protein
MAEPALPPKVKLFIGIIYESEEILLKAETILIKKYGQIDFKTIRIPFTNTEYYQYMGTNLFKVFLSFEKLIKREKIVKIKLFTSRLENRLSRSRKEKRKINIDPGYMTLSNVFLASCKDYFHRVYLGKGVYLENEYKYVEKRFQPWEWTYPDYKKQEYLSFFYNIRRIYHNQLRKK